VTGLPEKAVVVLLLTASLTGCTQVLDDFQNQTRGGPGSNYEAYLTGDRDLLVELDYASGAKWDTSRPAPQDFRKQMERITGKNVAIRTSQDLPSKGSDYAWSTSELRDLHEQHQDFESDDSRVVMHALFVDGDYQNQNTVGVAYQAQAFAMFMGKIEEVTCSNGAVVCNGAERYEVVRAVSIHEAGHLLGLVNAPLPMVTDHEDPDHEAHSINEDSVMFWKVENSNAITDLFSGGVPYEFDGNDVQDAEAQRGGGS
jgi:hypothetical protein